MNRSQHMAATVALALGMLVTGGTWAAAANEAATEPSRARTEARTQQAEERIYGWQLMTAEERQALRSRMRAAKTPEERAQIRREHHAAMQARARERGMELPDPPPGWAQGPGARRHAMKPDAGAEPEQRIRRRADDDRSRDRRRPRR